MSFSKFGEANQLLSQNIIFLFVTSISSGQFSLTIKLGSCFLTAQYEHCIEQPCVLKIIEYGKFKYKKSGLSSIKNNMF